ncbi:putative bifunctional diguanylate cyclase/phosphodiesterase [Rhodoferax sp. WC2427]|uniref:putative bifunctional diguanylate cyclase/phosphodiesterase n=1 Tax=Rhodoferax sp. WC2427 TaxID=3234144 RepID=UPI003466309A
MAGWNKYLIFGILASLCIPLADGLGGRDILYFFIVLYGMSGVFYGVLSHKPIAVGPWAYFLLAIFFQFSGALIQADTDVSGIFGSRLSLADGFLLSGHMCLVVALWQFACTLHREFPRHGFFQGCILATSLILTGWQFLFLPTIVEYGFSIDQPQIFRMVYPTMSYVEVGMLLWVWTSSKAYKSTVFTLLSVATVLFAAGESFFHGTSSSLGVPTNLNLLLWLLAYVTFGALALHPEMKQLSYPRPSEESSHVNNVLTLLLPLVLLLPVTLLVIYFKELHPATVGILGGFFLVMVLGWYQLRLSIQNIVRANLQLEEQNRIDYLTGIPNRKHIEQVIEASTYQLDKRNGLLLIDIDGFKSINNIFGFHVGDLIIKAIADRLYADISKNGNHFARVDGDEFALLMLNAENRRAIEAQAWQIHRLLENPVTVNGVVIRVMCSIGVSIDYGFEKLNFASMLKESERALGWARETQSQVEVYDKSKDIAEDKSWVLTDFRGAVTACQLIVYYQPKIHASTKKVIGVEALIRWHHPQRGLVMPYEFIQQIETTDLAHQLFTLVLHDAAKQWHIWSDQGLVLSIALNVVARDIMGFDLVKEIRGVLEQTNMPAKYLEIEITESSALSDPVHVKKVLSALMNLGVKISIDDYGTGYSSLLHLQQLPLHFLKIDQQFIRQMRDHQSSATIVSSTMELAKNLNVEVIAEGVEDMWVYQKLLSLGCYGVQGFLFSKAVVAESIVQVVQEIESAPVAIGDGTTRGY